jgi:hypothetical protein
VTNPNERRLLMNSLMTLYKSEDIPACDEGMALAEKFMEAVFESLRL